MSSYRFTQSLPLHDGWDVVVVGGGPAGCTAATAAAREGARTLLVEATGCLGGMGTVGLVPAWCPFSDKERVIYRGLAEQVFRATKQAMAHVNSEARDWVPIDAEALKRIYDALVTGAGATVLFNTQLCSVETDENGVSALILGNKDGLAAYRAPIYVDCTGDGDLAAWAGADFQKGDDATGELQPATHCFVLANVDTYAYLHGPRLHPAILKQILDSGRYPRIPDMHLCNNLVGPGAVGFNAGHLWDIDNTDPHSVSAALIAGRQLAAEFCAALREYHPAFANAFLANTGALMGIRETRRILGDYVLTIEDYVARRGFPDEICRNAYPIDIHTAKHEIAQSRQGQLNVMERYENYHPGESHGIPYRCLIPKNLRNVLTAGRAISCDRPVQGSIRVMPVCLAMGEAAGLAAALAAAGDADVHAVDTLRLCRRLLDEGAYLPDAAANTLV